MTFPIRTTAPRDLSTALVFVLAAAVQGCGSHAGQAASDGATAAEGPVGQPDVSLGPPPPRGWDDAIRLPAAVDYNPDPNVVEIDLEARAAAVEILPGILTQVWTFGGSLPGPLIRVPVGARLIVHFTNHLPEETTIHWHGVRLPADMDGVPMHTQQAVPPDGTFDYSFIVPDSGLFWYHPHFHSAKQVGNGLYGALLVDAQVPPGTPVGGNAGTGGATAAVIEPPALGPELVLVLSDILLTEDGQLGPADASGDLATLFGREGTAVLVNGHVAPTVLVRRGQRQRWRIVNAAKSRYFQLAMEGHRFTRIGGDGGLIPVAQESEMLVLTPGERADVLVTPRGEPGTTVPVRWVPYNRGFGSVEFRSEVELFHLRFTKDQAIVDAPPRLPDRLRSITAHDVSTATPREMQLTQDTVDGKLVLGIDNVPSWDAPPLNARIGDTEVWTVHNAMDWDHPFHLHGFFFQVLDSAAEGSPSALDALEWKDTVNIPRQKGVTIAIRFDERPGMWMFHCHILDHADAGMMGMVHLAP